MRNKRAEISARPTSTLTTVIVFFGLYLLSGWLRRGSGYFTQWLLSLCDGHYADFIKFSGALLALLLTVGLVVMYAYYGEGRRPRSLGFTVKGAPKEYFKGAAIGLGLICAPMLLAWAFGGIRFVGAADDFSIVAFVGALILGILNIREEVLFRGWFTTSLKASTSTAVAVFVGSVAFGLVHVGNNNVTALSVVNITLLGIFLALYFLRSGNIWGVAAIHTFWNFAQSHLFGLPMSGTAARTTLLKFEPCEGGLFGVGAFGLEGSWVTTAVLIVAIVLTVKNFSTFVKRNQPLSDSFRQEAERNN